MERPRENIYWMITLPRDTRQSVLQAAASYCCCRDLLLQLCTVPRMLAAGTRRQLSHWQLAS